MLGLGALFLARGVTNLVNGGRLIRKSIEQEMGEIAFLALTSLLTDLIVHQSLEKKEDTASKIMDIENNVIEFSFD